MMDGTCRMMTQTWGPHIWILAKSRLICGETSHPSPARSENLVVHPRRSIVQVFWRQGEHLHRIPAPDICRRLIIRLSIRGTTSTFVDVVTQRVVHVAHVHHASPKPSPWLPAQLPSTLEIFHKLQAILICVGYRTTNTKITK